MTAVVPNRRQRRAEANGKAPTAHAIRAASSRVRLDVRGKVTGGGKRQEWQRDAWEYFDAIGEVKQAAYFLANVVSQVRLFIAEVPDDPEQEPAPAPAGTLGLAEAEEALDRLRRGSVYGGIGGLLAESVLNLKVAGECFLIGEPEVPADPANSDPEKRGGRPEQWDVKSTDEVKVEGRKVEIIDAPNDTPREVKIAGPGDDDATDTVALFRVWQRHPRFSALADSALRGVLTECDELVLLSRAIRGAALSRAAGAGILAVPDDMSFPVDPDVGDDVEDPELDSFIRKLSAALTEPINDPGSPESVVPLVLRGKGEHLDKIRHITLDRPLDATASKQREELVKRLGHGLDIPVEELTGLADVNHWSAKVIDDSTWSRYGQPTTRAVCESWTEGYLWSSLDADGVDAAGARRLMIWFTPGDAIADPDESKTADEAFDRGAIDWSTYRTAKGYSEENAPTDAELDRRAELGLMKGGNRTQTPADEGSSEPTPTPEAHAITASARRPLGERLMRIDRDLRARLEEAADAAMRRAIERAGARLRRAVQGNAQARTAVASVPAHLVASVLGVSLVAALDLTEDELLEEAFAEMRPRFDERTRRAQSDARAILADELDMDDAELRTMERQQDDDRGAAWLWLAGALRGLATQRLYDPTPASPGTGEFDAALTVPPGVLRDAMTRAGGAVTGPPATGPIGGVATGNLVMDVWARHGGVVSGWQWVHGDPERPFDAHEELDGEEFATFADPVLEVRAGDEWLGVAHYRPGDHAGCTCDFTPVMEGPS